MESMLYVHQDKLKSSLDINTRETLLFLFCYVTDEPDKL